MSKLAQMLLDAIEEWKRTGRLPNGEYWNPEMEKEESVTEETVRDGFVGIEVNSFYERFCSQTTLTKRAAKSVLLHLEKEGYVKINWHSKHGARFYPIRKSVV